MDVPYEGLLLFASMVRHVDIARMALWKRLNICKEDLIIDLA